MNLRNVEFETVEAESWAKINEYEVVFYLNKDDDTDSFVETIKDLFEDNCEEIRDLTIIKNKVTEWQAYLLDNVDDFWSQSPYSDSFYNSDDIGWDSKPLGSLRVSDHWNFWSRGQKHCELEYEPKINQQWLVARYTITGYEIDQEVSDKIVDYDWSRHAKSFQKTLSMQSCDYAEDSDDIVDGEVTLTAEQQQFVTKQFLQKNKRIMATEPYWFKDQVKRDGLNDELIEIAESQNCDMYYLTNTLLKNADCSVTFDWLDKIELENGDLIITGANVINDERYFERPDGEKFTWGEKAEKAEIVADKSSSFADWQEGMESLEDWCRI